MLVSFMVWRVITNFFPLTIKLIEIALTGLFAFSAILLVLARLKESKVVSMVAYYWCSLLLPLSASQLLAMEYLTQFVSINNFIWVFMIYWAMLPFVVAGLVLYSNMICWSMVTEESP